METLLTNIEGEYNNLTSGERIETIALVGNPNSGKTSLFNRLTGLRQKVGNYPGITVEKKTGYFKSKSGKSIRVLDLPGTYSVYPGSRDEMIVLDILMDENHDLHPDLIIVIVDASNLKRNLLLLTQIRDLGYPVVCAMNMVDVALSKGIAINTELLQSRLVIPVVPINARMGYGIKELIDVCNNLKYRVLPPVYTPEIPEDILDSLKSKLSNGNKYKPAIWINQTETVAGISNEDRIFIRELKSKAGHAISGLQGKETLARYRWIGNLVKDIEQKVKVSRKVIWKEKLDKVLMHRVYGYIIFTAILFLIFQAIFSWAESPMDWIDLQFGRISFWIKQTLPAGVFVDMVSEGIIPGLGGIAIFIPQIALLFTFIAILEDSGYMSRVVFLMDKIMRRFGLSGKSVVPLISGMACAIPAIMSTRNIENWKERIISIMVTPLMTCSARLPVYIILIALVVPEGNVGGWLNLQGLVLLGLYALGFISAIGAAYLFKKFIKAGRASFLVMEMPTYKTPRLKNVVITVIEKSKTFVLQAGKIILAISLILWVLASYGPGSEIQNAETRISQEFPEISTESKEFKNKVNAYKLEHSYIAALGKTIEPAIAPLGFDWKIGIALITSFAAREVFVSTIATIYSVGSDFDNEATIKRRMKAEVNSVTGEKVFTPAVAFSLLIFYAFAMQCMSTLAIVYKETNGIKWPLIQFAFMSVLAYISSLIVFQVLTRIL